MNNNIEIVRINGELIRLDSITRISNVYDDWERGGQFRFSIDTPGRTLFVSSGYVEYTYLLGKSMEEVQSFIERNPEHEEEIRKTLDEIEKLITRREKLIQLWQECLDNSLIETI